MKSILLVDHNSQRRNNLSSRLRTSNYLVEIVGSGFQALHLIEKSTYDILYICEGSSDMPGLEIIALTRDIREKTELPILFSAKDQTSAEIIEAFEVGANEFIEMDATFNLVLSKLKKLNRIYENYKKG